MYGRHQAHSASLIGNSRLTPSVNNPGLDTFIATQIASRSAILELAFTPNEHGMETGLVLVNYTVQHTPLFIRRMHQNIPYATSRLTDMPSTALDHLRSHLEIYSAASNPAIPTANPRPAPAVATGTAAPGLRVEL